MEKALEKIKEIIDFCDAVGCHRAIYESIKFVEKELEEAMKPKTCYGCSNLFSDEIEKVYKCSNDVSDDVGYLHGEAVIRNIKDFHCVQHQPKDNSCTS